MKSENLKRIPGNINKIQQIFATQVDSAPWRHAYW